MFASFITISYISHKAWEGCVNYLQDGTSQSTIRVQSLILVLYISGGEPTAPELIPRGFIPSDVCIYLGITIPFRFHD